MAVQEMTPEARAKFVGLFSGPRPQPGKDRHHYLQYIPVERDGVIEFIRDPFDAEMERILAEVLDELFGPEPAADVELPDVFKVESLNRQQPSPTGGYDVRP